MKATDLLKRQHREVEKLFARVKKTDDADEREQLVEQIRSKLELHTQIEEEIFYPAYRAGAETHKAEEAVLEAYEEHHVVKLVLGELPEIDCEAESFEAKITVLEELVQHHVEEEESSMFPDAEKKLGKGRLEQLGEELNERVTALGADGDADAEQPEHRA